jgi:hypothetical protein
MKQEILRAIEDLRNGLGQFERLAVGWSNDVIPRIRTKRKRTENLRSNDLYSQLYYSISVNIYANTSRVSRVRTSNIVTNIY